MGCGSSSTQVKEFRPVSRQNSITVKRVENHTKQTAHKTIREKSEVSNKSDKAKHKENSCSTNSSRVSLSEKAKSGRSSRSSSAKSSRASSAKSDRKDKGNASKASSAKSDRKDKENEKTEKDVHAYYALLNQADNLNEEAKSEIDEIQTIDVVHSDAIDEKVGEADNDSLYGETGGNDDNEAVAISKAGNRRNEVDHETRHEVVDRQTIHENSNVKHEGEHVGTKTENADGDENEYDEYSGYELCPIDIPEINKNKEFPEYTVDDIVNNNAEKGKNNWFLYGRKVYTLDLFTPIVFSRVQEYLNMTDQDQYTADDILSGKTEFGSYPVYVARNNGVRGKEMIKILPASQIGRLQSISREEYLSRLKQSVDNVKSDLEAHENLNEYLVDYLEQLSRWLVSYPNVELEQPMDRNNIDPNQCEFPLPDKIRADSSVIRQWAKDWVEFDMKIDEDGAWSMLPLISEDWGDVHQTFVDYCAKHVDAEIPDMNMEIEGEAAWDVIKLDIFKNDETTEEQETTWKAREKRKDLDDRERMSRRRKEIADSFLKRHDTRLKPEDMVEYGEWANRLEKHWKEFQELCETYVPRQRVQEKERQAPDATDLEPKKLSDNDEHTEQVANESQEPKQLPENIPPQDTVSIRSGH